MSNIETAEGISRREFLKAGVGLAAVISGIESVKAEPVIYSQLSSNKIQPLREGCLVGLFKPNASYNPIFLMKIKEITAKAKSMDEFAEMFKKEGLHK